MHLSPKVNKQTSAPFELVHSTGFKYFVTFIDDLSRFTWLYLMKSHSELFSHFCVFCDEIQTQFHVFV